MIHTYIYICAYIHQRFLFSTISIIAVAYQRDPPKTAVASKAEPASPSNHALIIYNPKSLDKIELIMHVPILWPGTTILLEGFIES